MSIRTKLPNLDSVFVRKQPPQAAPDSVNAALASSMQAVGVTSAPSLQVPATGDQGASPPPRKVHLSLGVLVVSNVVLALLIMAGRDDSPPRLSNVVVPTSKPVATPTHASLPTSTPPAPVVALRVPDDPSLVTLSPVTLYGDYADSAVIGPAPNGLSCTLAGHAPDSLWAFLSCPSPTGTVWAKVDTLKLSESQQAALKGTQVIARVPTATAPAPSTRAVNHRP